MYSTHSERFTFRSHQIDNIESLNSSSHIDHYRLKNGDLVGIAHNKTQKKISKIRERQVQLMLTIEEVEEQGKDRLTLPAN